MGIFRFFVCLFLLGLGNSIVYALDNGEFKYELTDDGAQITGCVGPCPEKIIIPNSINGLDVHTIGGFAMESELEEVEISEGIKIIADCAFCETGLSSISLPESLVEIHEQAFLQSFYNLSTFTIPQNVSFIGVGAFSGDYSSPQIDNLEFLGDMPEGAYTTGVWDITYCASGNGWPGDIPVAIKSSISPNCDSDNDGVTDAFDDLPLNPDEMLDTDGDGIGNNADTDDDGDGTLDEIDQYPLIGKYSKDTDSDGLPDSYEVSNGLNIYLPSDAHSDTDNDGLTAAEEFSFSTNPNSDDSDRDGLKDSWEIENNQNPLVAAYQVSAGYDHTCILDDSGVVCWGGNNRNQTDVPELINPTQVSAGGINTCALDDSGVVCWGLVYSHATGLPDINNPTQISAGGISYFCALDDSGVVCWPGSDVAKKNLPHLINPTQVSAGPASACAIDDTGIICWGNNDYGQLNVPNLSNPTQVSLGYNHACAIDDLGVTCWRGLDESTESGYGNTNVPELNNPKQVSLGSSHTCAIDDSGVVCWGNNDHGQTDVPALSNPTQVSSGGHHSCALDDSGLVCWGRNDAGQTNEHTLFIDLDGDGYSAYGGQDLFPLDQNEWLDTDLDGVGNNTDTDDDGDGVLDSEDLFPLNASDWADTDNDGLGDNEDTDADNDGIVDIYDDFPLDSTEQLDTDADGIGNNTDTDDDGDGIADVNDAFPLNGLYSVDSDNDGMADAWEILYGLNPNDPSDTISDQDDDGAVALQEFIEGTLPVADADNDGLSNNYEVSIGTDPNDADSDDDGVSDKDDMFPLNSVETNDTDLDGVGDLLDPDANGDGIFENHVFTLNQLQGLFLSESRQATIENDYFEIGVDQNGLDREILWRIPITEVDSIIQGKTFSVEIEIEEKRNFGHYEKDLFVGISDGAKVLSYFNRVADANHILLASDTNGLILNETFIAEIEGGDLSNYKLRFDFYGQMVRVSLNNQAIAFDDNELVIDLSVHDYDVSKQLNLVVAGSEGNESFAIKTLNISYPDANVDLDQDGIFNDYETANGLNPVDASDAQSDSDMDGLTALEEFTLGTSPTNDDTDRDTLPDGWEVENGRDPLVADYQIAVGVNASCARDDSGWTCWGNSDHDANNIPVLQNPSQMAVTASSRCALDDSGVICWGFNGSGQVNVPELTDPIKISIGHAHTCAIDATGVVCWGSSQFGKLFVPPLSNPSQVSLGGNHSCAIDDTGVVCWGKNEHGQTDVPFLSNPAHVSAGYSHSCALDDTGVVCWGGNDHGQTDVPFLSNPVQVSAGSSHNCALDDTGVVCWGGNWDGQIDVPKLSNPTQVSSGSEHTCALDDSGVVCWGGNVSGQTNIPNLIFDPDDDGFSSQNGSDAFPLDPSERLDTDFDGVGNNSDLDDDGDGFEDTLEIQNGLDPLVANPDIDNDGIANELDTDNDNDGSLDIYDVFPLDVNEQIDSDSDGIGDNADADNDNDGVINSLDLFPLDAFESADFDGDGIGDNADFFPNSAEYSLDSDLDQMPDAWERKYGLNPTDASDALLDQDNDGLTALEEYEAGTIPLKILDIDANGSFDALTDGLIILRYAFGLRGENLVRSATAGDAMRTDAADVEAYLNSLVPGL